MLHPRRGLLILEVKDWRLDGIQQADRESWTLLTSNGAKTVANPLVQARHCAHQVCDALA